ncbi:MAG: hypothetical protein QOE06_1695 [Thermoleophilaceae bacterium]|jgi:hypothetical protein|nr:hypothetical protein [Thermoleophilaceae bacterium]
MRPLALSGVLALALLTSLAASAPAETIYTIDGTAPPTLQSFDSATPGTLTTIGAVTGLQSGEGLAGIDFDPATGELFGLGNTARLYKIDPATGAATARTITPIAFTIGGGGAVGMDFDPTTGLLRLVNQSEQNVRVDPATGDIVHVDGNLHPADGTVSPSPVVAALAYTDNVPGAKRTTAFGSECNFSQTVTLGSSDGPTVPEVGIVSGVGAEVQCQVPGRVGMDVGPTGTVYASAVDASTYRLFTVNRQTGAFTLVGAIGNGNGTQRDIAVAPVRNDFSLTSSAYSVNEADGFATVTVNRTGSRLGAASVAVLTIPAGSTASEPGDYLETRRVLQFEEGDASTSVRVPIVNDTQVEDDETVSLILGNQTGGDARLASPATATLTIHSDDAAPVTPVTPVVPDTTKPGVAVTAPSVVSLKGLLAGLTPSATPNEPASLEFDLLASATSITAATNGDVVLASAAFPLGGGTRSAKLKPASKLVKHQRKSFKVRVRVIPTDAAGNRGAPVIRTVKVKVPRPKR